MRDPDVDVAWYSGAGETPGPIQVHWASDDLVILRQSIDTHYEAPFIYLLFGTDAALLLDTGATADPVVFPLRAFVDALIEECLGRNPADGYRLIVAHTHAHSDHVAGDGQFADRADSVVVGTAPDAVASFFAVADWPTGTGSVDLGDRVLDVLPIPGHEPSSIAIYDRGTGALLTGDTVYPGRLYAPDFASFRASIDRLCDFAAAHPVSVVLGAHIEMSRAPEHEFAIDAPRHPDEAALAMTPAQLLAVRDAVHGVAAEPGIHQFDDFAIWNGLS